MSKTRDILILQADGDQVTLVRARNGSSIELLDPGVFRPRETNKAQHLSDDPFVRESLAAHVVQHGWRGREVVCLLGGSLVACQYCELPRLKEAELQQAVLLKLKSQLHFDVAEAIVAINIIDQFTIDQTEHVRVQSTAAQRDRITSLLDAAEHAGLRVAGISATPAAIIALAREYLKAEKGSTAALYVDETTSTLIVLKDGLPFVTTELSMGLSSLTAALMRPIIDGERVIQLDEAQATTIRNTVGIAKAGQMVEAAGVDGQRLAPLLEPVLQKLAKHLTQWLTFAATTTDRNKIDVVRLVGPGAGIPNLGEAMAARIDREVRSEQWLRDATISSPAGQPPALESCAAIVGAVRHGEALPDLLPPERRLQQRLGRVRKAVVSCGVIVAAASLGLAVLFGQISARVMPSVELQRQHLPTVQEVVGQNQRWMSREAALRRMEAQFDAVSRDSPLWSGLLKELALRLPSEVRATELTARSVDDGMRLTVSGEVLLRRSGEGFDRTVEQTLLQLQRSAFFKRVRLLSAKRESEEGKEAAGTLSVELDLIHPRGGTRT